MNGSHKELLRQMQELLQASERRMTARYGRSDRAIDSCLTMGGTASSSSTSAGSDVCCVAEVPAPASCNPDASLAVAIDVEDLATPTPAKCSMEGPSRDTTELRSASASATAPTTPTATVDIIPVLAAAAASDEILDDEAISGVAGAPATCSMVCLPRHPMVAPVLVASPPPTPTEYVLDTSILVATVPPATAGVFSSVLAPTDCTPTVQMQQLYNDNGDETRPLPWPSFKEIDGCESPSDAVMKPSRQYRFGNLFTSTGCIIINDMCISSELRCLDVVLLFLQYWSSTSDCVQSVHATFVWPPCSITRFNWDIIRSIELELLSNGSMPVTLRTVLLDSGNFSDLSCEYLDFPCRSAVTVCLSCPQEPDQYFGSSQLKESLIMNSMRRSDNSYDHFSCAFRDTSHWPEYFVTGVHMHVSATCSVRRLLLIVPVTSVLFRNLVKFLVRPKKQHSELLYVLGIYLAKLSGMVREFQNWLIYMLQHPNSRRPESAMTRAISHVSASEPIPITFHVFAMSLELALNHAAMGQRVLLILSHYNALRYWVLWSFITAVPAEIVSMFNTHPSAAVMIELVSAVAADHSWDVPLFFSMYPSISFGTVQIFFSAYMSDKLVSVAPVAIWWFPSAPCKFRSHKCMHGIHTNERRVESLGGPTCVLYSRTSFLLLVRLIMVKSKQQVAVYSNCPAYRQLGLGTNTTGYSDCKDSMMVVNNSAISIHVKELQGAYVSAQLQWGNIVSVLTCGLIDLGKFCPNWKFVHSAIGRPAWLIPIQSVALKNMELWWFTTALLTEIASMFSTGLSMQLACSVQSTLLFTYAYQLSLLALTMFSFAWDNVDSISNSRTTRCALQIASLELLVFIVALGSGQGTSQGGRHQPGLDRHKVLRLLWDPGGVTTAAWGQAELQGGRGVRDPPIRRHGLGLGSRHGLGPLPRTSNTSYKYTRHGNEEGIRIGSRLNGSGSSPPASLFSPSLLLCSSQILAEILVSEYLCC